MSNLFRSWPARLVTLFLLAQAALLYSSIRPEAVPPSQPLVSLPTALGEWHAVGDDGLIEPEVLDVLKADDVLNREYADAAGSQANLYIAAFRSQRNGKAPHSPKNCLPGSGWTPMVEDYSTVELASGRSIEVNHYIVNHGELQSLVLYWYQSRDRVVANEYKAKFWVVADSMRYNRSDTALVRVIVSIHDHDNAQAERVAVNFVRSFFEPIRTILPS
jgi:EpsI family protein